LAAGPFKIGVAMRSLALIAVKLAISAFLIAFATRRINIDIVRERLNQLDYGWLVAAFAIALLQTILLGVRWQRIVLMCGVAMTSGRAIRFTMIAAFFSQVLPSTVGGDAARIWLLVRDGVRWWTSTYSVLLDRFVGVLVLGALVAAGLYWSLGLIANPVGRVVLLCIGLGNLAGGAIFLMLGYWRLLGRWTIMRPLAELAVLGNEILFSRRCGPVIVSISLLIHMMTALCAWSIAQAAAARLGYFDAFLLVLPVMLIVTIPVSIAGWGVRESALVTAFAYAGLAAEDGLVVSVLLGLIQFAVGLAGGAIWLASADGMRISDVRHGEQQPPAR
jgi:uncharacterized membrane protein YbhN (UPF0104 family)